MKKTLLLVSVLFCLNLYAQEQPLTNNSIIEMIDLGFSSDIIISKIETSPCDFNTSIDALKSMKEKGIDNSIIVAMIHRISDIKTNEAQRSGIYYKNGDDFIQLFPTVFSGTKTNTLGAALSYGIASAKVRSTMNGQHSNNVIENNNPEFYFYFIPRKSDLGVSASNWWFSAASSPNEFALVRLTTKKGRRELETGSVNLYAGTSIGVDEKNHIQIDIEKIDDYTFKVKPRYFLNTGEYCFYYQGSIPQGGYNNQSVFDFSIPQSCALEFYNKYSKAILEKYKGIEGIYALPVPVNQRMNKYIKEICKACEINEPICRTYYKGAERIDEIHPKYELIGTHCGRKTFICNALMLGIAPNIVMKWTGHRDYKSMKPYIDIADKAKEEAMNLFNR